MEPRPRPRRVLRPAVQPQLRELRPLLPVDPRASPANSSNQRLSRRRSPVVTACEPCRKRKIKCDGQRPECAACAGNYRPCRFISEFEESRVGVLKRTLGDKIELAEDLQQSCNKYQKIIHALRSRSEDESIAIVKLIRQGHDCETVLLHLKASHQLLELQQDPLTPAWPPSSPSIISSPEGSQSSEDASDVIASVLRDRKNLVPERAAVALAPGGPSFPHDILNTPETGTGNVPSRAYSAKVGTEASWACPTGYR